jgi:mannose-6-phosphate isomerase-like protein (cupin superfamily)
MIEEIKNEGRTLAIIIRANYKAEGIEFFTPDDYSQQLAYMNRPTGHVILPHTHKEVEREVKLTQEVLFVKSGKVRVDYYDDDQNYLQSNIISKGDVILLAAGGHGFKILEEAEMIEVKQGPYSEEEDKVRFEPVNDDLLIFKE